MITRTNRGDLLIRSSEMPESLTETNPARLRYLLGKLAKSLRGLGASLDGGQDPVRLLNWLSKNLRFPT